MHEFKNWAAFVIEISFVTNFELGKILIEILLTNFI